MDLGPNAAFVWASYAAVAIVLGVLIVWLVADGMHQQRKLNELEARGTRRRSAQTSPGAESDKRGDA
jgi:heme exporter protein D